MSGSALRRAEAPGCTARECTRSKELGVPIGRQSVEAETRAFPRERAPASAGVPAQRAGLYECAMRRPYSKTEWSDDPGCQAARAGFPFRGEACERATGGRRLA